MSVSYIVKRMMKDNDIEEKEWQKPFPHLIVKMKASANTGYWQQAFNEPDEHKSFSRRRDNFNLPRFVNCMPVIQKAICKSQFETDPRFAQRLRDGIQSEQLQITECKMVCTLYWQNTDSFIKPNDFVWTRRGIFNKIGKVRHIWRIKGAEDAGIGQYIDEDNVDSINDFVILVTDLWDEITNLEEQNWDNLPTISPTIKPYVIAAKFVVQQLFCMHDHVLGDQESLDEVHQLFPTWWPKAKNWPGINNNNINQLVPSEPRKLPFCGFGIICMEHKMYRCLQCRDLPINIKNWELLSYCNHTEHPNFKVYSIYQGFIPRFFNSKSINELENHFYEKIKCDL